MQQQIANITQGIINKLQKHTITIIYRDTLKSPIQTIIGKSAKFPRFCEVRCSLESFVSMLVNVLPNRLEGAPFDLFGSIFPSQDPKPEARDELAAWPQDAPFWGRWVPMLHPEDDFPHLGSLMHIFSHRLHHKSRIQTVMDWLLSPILSGWPSSQKRCNASADVTTLGWRMAAPPPKCRRGSVSAAESARPSRDLTWESSQNEIQTAYFTFWRIYCTSNFQQYVRHFIQTSVLDTIWLPSWTEE